MIVDERSSIFFDETSDIGIGKTMPQGNENRYALDDFGGTAEMSDQNPPWIRQLLRKKGFAKKRSRFVKQAE